MAHVAAITCTGHPAIRASHAKTLEFSRDPEVGQAATCVLGVAAQVDEGELARLRGRVRVAIACGGLSDELTARANPAYRPGRELIARRHGAVVGNAFLIDASKTAADIDRALVRAARSPDALISVRLEPVVASAGRGGALFVVPTSSWALGPAAAGHEEFVAGCDEAVTSGSAADPGELRAAVEEGARVALVVDGDADLAAAQEAIGALAGAGVDLLPSPGLTPLAATVLVSGEPLERLLVLRDTAAELPSGATLAWLGDVGGYRAAARDLRRRRPAAALTLGVSVGEPREQFLRAAAGEDVPSLPTGTKGAVALVVGPGADQREDAEALDRIVRALLDQGWSPRSLADLLKDTGVLSRRDAYSYVLDRRDDG